MFMIKVIDKANKDNAKAYSASSREEAEKLTAALRKDFDIEIRETNIEKVTRYIVQEETRCYIPGFEGNWCETVAILDSYPDDSFLLFLASQKEAELKETCDSNITVKIYKNILDNYCCGCFCDDDDDKIEDVYEFSVRAESLFESNKEE